MNNTLAGKILISTPHIGDPRFEKAVIFICAHDENGAMGLMINKPLTNLNLSELLEQLKLDVPPEKEIRIPVYMGGPLEPEKGFLLHSSMYNTQDSTVVGSSFGVSGTLDSLSRFSKEGNIPSDVIFALGYAGWGETQLQDEIRDGAWLLVDATPDLVFDTKSIDLWDASMAHLGVNPALLTGVVGKA